MRSILSVGGLLFPVGTPAEVSKSKGDTRLPEGLQMQQQEQSQQAMALSVWLQQGNMHQEGAWCPGVFLRLCGSDFRQAHVLYRLAHLWLGLRQDATHPELATWMSADGLPHLRITRKSTIFEYIPGVSAKRVLDQLSKAGLVSLAWPEGRFGGTYVHLHAQRIIEHVTAEMHTFQRPK